MSDPWTSFVVELSSQTTVIEVLMSTHMPTKDGLCRSCTTPGRGTPQKQWPCSLWMLADAARHARVQRSLK